MRASRLIVRGLTYYWRTNIAVVLGVATAVAVLAGALLVGDSVRASLRDLVLSRLGRTDQIVLSETFFREQLAQDVSGHPLFRGASDSTTPLVIVRAVVTDQESGRRAGHVRVYGVDDRFWRFHGVAGGTKVPPLRDVAGPVDRQAFLSPALAREIGTEPGRAVLVRVERPSDIPLESLHSRKDDVGRTIRLTVEQVLPRERLGEFSLEPQQGDVRAVFVPLSRLQAELEVGRRVNALLVRGGAALADVVDSAATLEDLGLSVRIADDKQTVIVSSSGGLIEDAQVAALNRVLDGGGIRGQPVFTYLANTMSIGDRHVPYSLVTATDLRALSASLPTIPPDSAEPVPIVLNEWAARDLQAKSGDTLKMDYYVWVEPGRIESSSRFFRVAGIVPIAAGGRDLVPTYPGITEAASIDDWDPPFPVDLSRIRKVDEEYWDAYRTTPKAFIPLDAGQRLWSSRYGSVTSVRVPTDTAGAPALRDRLEAELRAALDPNASGLMVKHVRAESLDASQGATDFGEYFVYFSFFLVVSALLLASLFFKLGIEQRGREVGLLRAVGYGAAGVRQLFMGEGLLLALAGSALGIVGGIGYAWLIMTALRTWWVDAVGTTALTLHVTPMSLAAGALGGIAAAAACIWWTLRSLRRISERSLLAGQISFEPGADSGRVARRLQVIAALFALSGLGLVGAGAGGRLAANGAFFGAGALLLTGSLCLFAGRLRVPARTPVVGTGWRPVTRLGLRAATYRPGRSVLSAAVIASATFMLISVDAFRRGSVEATSALSSGVGGYQILVETLLPIVQDPNSDEGRRALGLTALGDATRLEPFRLLPGDDASCLNLYAPKNPRILGASDSFLNEGRFTFASSAAVTDAERDNPWSLLKRTEPDGAIPVIGDANSMTYVLHRAVGEEFVLDRGGEPIRLRFVAALRDSVFQGELIMAESNFVRLFPDQQGVNVLLVEAPTEDVAALTATIEESLADLGADATATADRLAAFHQVENTYLSTFQTLGGLGLLLGTVGLATVLLRNALERRKELALLSAVGYRRGHFGLMALAENTLLLGVGLIAGAASASLAIAPAVVERGGRVPLTASGVLLLCAVFVIGLLSSALATRSVTRAPLLASLRSE